MSTFLYKIGDECIDITGGFISSPYALAGTSVAVIKNSDNMQLNPNGVSKYTTLSHNNAIDLTEYKRIYFDIEVTSTLGTNQWVRLGLSTTNNSNDYGVGEVSVKNQIGRKLYYIDLDNKSGLAFVKAHINSGAGAISPFISMKIHNIWLEKTIEKLPISSSLVDTVEHVKNVNDEIYFLKAKLENNLIEKGIECSDTNKMSSLIDKITNIELGIKWASGNLGTYFNSNNNRVWSSVTVEMNLSFIPSTIFIFIDYINSMTETAFIISNIYANSDNQCTTTPYIHFYINQVDSQSFNLNYKMNGTVNKKAYILSWYAFE